MRPGLVFSTLLCILASCSVPSDPPAYAGGPVERRPVVVELFSSEGCSSCPPADAVLRALSATQPVAGAEIVALEMHVDYWNDLGWADPFSRAAFTDRQRGYAGGLGRSGLYTPQMVIDGARELLGSRREAAQQAIAQAAKAPKADVRLARQDDRLHVTVSALPSRSEPLRLWLAITEEGLQTEVPRGENAGSTLLHGPVVRQLKKIATIPQDAPNPVVVQAPLVIEPGWQRNHLRAVAFVQQARALRILGAGVTSLQ